jgi:hypothetical protein
MGFFSWLTNEGVSISNSSSSKGALPVYMYLPDDTVIFEDDYDGYGVFGGLDFYDLVAKYNFPKEELTGNPEIDRDKGIDLIYRDSVTQPIIMPRFSIYKNEKYENLNDPQDCPDQGYFYPTFDDEGEEY